MRIDENNYVIIKLHELTYPKFGTFHRSARVRWDFMLEIDTLRAPLFRQITGNSFKRTLYDFWYVVNKFLKNLCVWSMSAVLLHLFKRGRILHLCENLSFDRFCIEIHDDNMTVDKKVKKLWDGIYSLIK